MDDTRKNYSKEFKQQAVELSHLRGNVREAADSLGIDVGLLYAWRSELKKKPDLAFGGKGKKQMTETEKEIARLKKELADAKMERDILKKAVSIFSLSDRKSTNS
jgi:transposase